jgi:hypothetical protein
VNSLITIESCHARSPNRHREPAQDRPRLHPADADTFPVDAAQETKPDTVNET